MNPNGNPVRGFTVYAIPQDISLDSVSPRSTTTNEAGEFDFRGGFALGTYKLYSKKMQKATPTVPIASMPTLKLKPQKLNSRRIIFRHSNGGLRR